MVEQATTDTVGLYAALLAGELEGSSAARASQQMLNMVTDSIPQAVFWKDRDLRYLGCNEIFAEIAGMSVEELIGKDDMQMSWGPYEGADYQRWDRHVMTTNTPRYCINEPIHRPDGEVRWLETNKVPIRDFDGEVVGVLGTFQDVTDRIQAQMELTRTLADLDKRVSERTKALSTANVALRLEVAERARLQELEREQRAYAEALRDTAAAFTRSQDVEDVLGNMVNYLHRLIDLDLAAVYLVDDDGEASLAHSTPTHRIELHRLDPEGLLLGDMLHQEGTEFPLHIDPSLPPAVGAHLGAGTRSLLCAPMEIAGERVGYAVAERRLGGRFSEEDEKAICFVADQAAASLRNVRLIQHASELATINERQRLARELHDAVSQTLWSASLTADSLSTVEDPAQWRDDISRLQILAKGALAEMRNLLVELRPSAIEESDLPALISQLVAAFSSRKAASVHHCIEPVHAVGPAVKQAIYRIVQEALTNVTRHATPTDVYVGLSERGGFIEAVVRDNGGGFDPGQVRPGHFGLRIMEERATALGGTFSLTSLAGVTTVRVAIPGESNV